MPAPVGVLVQPGDTWASIAQQYGVSSVEKLLLLNKISHLDITDSITGNITLLLPLPGTFVVVSGASNIAPECTCARQFFIYSEDLMSCVDPYTTSSLPRLVPSAYLPSLVTAIDPTSFWQPLRTALVSDLYMDLQFSHELFEISFTFSRTSGLPARVEIYTTSQPNTNTYTNTNTNSTFSGSQLPVSSFTQGISAALARGESIWVRAYVFLPASQVSNCGLFPFCTALLRGFMTGTIPTSSTGLGSATGDMLRIRIFRDPAETKAVEIQSIDVYGRCGCNGHASTCWNTQPNGAQACQCQHNTMGKYCDQCQPMFNNKAWASGTSTASNPCVACNCNNHSMSCIYNATLDAFAGSRELGGGGVCQNCDGFTTGRNCENCLPQYFHPAGAELTDNCVPCQCKGPGSVSPECAQFAVGAIVPGQCTCKANVLGMSCSECRDGFFNLSQSNPAGCSPCNCDPYGSLNGTCDQVSGQCFCKAGTTGLKCNSCRAGLWDLRQENPDGCRTCFAGTNPNTFMFSDPVTNACLYCDPQCLQCNGPNATNCLQCRNLRFENTCVATCPAVFYPDSNNVCQSCHPECAQGCTGPLSSQCTACKNFIVDQPVNGSILLNNCVPRCPSLYFADTTRRCNMCNEQCNTSCVGPLPTQCAACKYVALGSTCLQTCPAGTYADSNRQCKPCNVQCRDTCKGPTAADCDACLNFNNTLDGRCVQQCPLTTYSDSQAQCLPCDGECFQSCTGPGPSQCYASCTTSGCQPTCKRALLISSTLGRTCVAQCGSDMYQDTLGQCQMCDPLCDTCTGAGVNACRRCRYFTYGSTCYAQCPIGTWASSSSQSNSSGTCTPCHPECGSQGCYGPGASNCVACARVNNSGVCQFSCPPFTYLQDNNCLACHPECATGCSGPGANQCQNGNCRRVSYQSSCLPACPAGTLTLGTICQACPYGNYFLDSTGNCSLCNSECTGGCSGPSASECLGPCKKVSISISNVTTCLPSCPSMTYAAFDRDCKPCNSLCAAGCTGPTPAMCTACKFHQFGGQCLTSCPTGTHGANGIDCTPCNSECTACYGNGPLQCTQCEHALDSALGCVASCSLDQWTATVNNVTRCVPCTSVPGLALDNNVCRIGCPLGKYVDKDSGICRQCDSQCSIATGCSGPGPSNCNSCATAKLNGVCVSACPTHSYLGAQGVCTNCSSQCLPTMGCVGPADSDCMECAVFRYPASAPLGPACRNGQSCARCVSECPGVINNGLCTTSCDSNKYVSTSSNSNNTCLLCDPLCAAGCVGGGPSACKDGLCRLNKLLTGTCVASCPPFTVAISNLCQPCDSQCALGCTGLGPSQCLNGSCATATLNRVCVSQCPLGQFYFNSPGSLCQACRPGYFCSDGIESRACSQGSYQDVTGQSACKSCPPNSICPLDLTTGLYRNYVCRTGFATPVNGTPCTIPDPTITTPAPTAAPSTAKEEDNTATTNVAVIVAVCAGAIVLLAILAIIRLRRQNHSVTATKATDSFHASVDRGGFSSDTPSFAYLTPDQPSMHTMALDTTWASPTHLRSVTNETYM